MQSVSQTPDLEAQSEEAKPAVLPGQISLDAAAKRQVWDQLAERAMGKQLKTRTGGELHGRLEGALRASAVARMSPQKKENQDAPIDEMRNFLDFRGASQLAMLTQQSQVFRARETLLPEAAEEFRSGHRVFWAAREGAFVAVCAFRVEAGHRYALDALGQVVLAPGAVEPFVHLRGEGYVFVSGGRECVEDGG